MKIGPGLLDRIDEITGKSRVTTDADTQFTDVAMETILAGTIYGKYSQGMGPTVKLNTPLNRNIHVTIIQSQPALLDVSPPLSFSFSFPLSFMMNPIPIRPTNTDNTANPSWSAIFLPMVLTICIVMRVETTPSECKKIGKVRCREGRRSNVISPPYSKTHCMPVNC